MSGKCIICLIFNVSEIMKTNKIILFAVIPFFTNLVLVGLYFSGIKNAQQLVVPTIDWLPEHVWREFGIVEQLQNIYLLATIIIFAVAALKKPKMFEKIFFLSGLLLVLFIFLEEIDYGIHFYEFASGQPSGIEVRNWHNQETAGKQNVRYFKQIVDVLMVIWFFLLPLFSDKIKYVPLKKIIPSRWFIIVFIISVVFSRVAHFLEGMDWDVINSNTGNLKGNISEFRETTTYYFYLLYAVQLVKTDFNSIDNRRQETKSKQNSAMLHT